MLDRTAVAERKARQAHRLLRHSGRLPEGILPAVIESSWRRCLEHGPPLDQRQEFDPGRRDRLDLMRQRNKELIDHALPIMETLYEQIANTQSMVVLADATGFILHSLGDADFLARAQRVALSPGVEWSECRRGTNAIGTALAEQAPVVVHGPQHFLPANHFLTCSAAPLRDPYGRIVGVLDVTGDHRRFSPHTLALANMSARMIENHLFCHAFRGTHVVRLHARPEFLGTLYEGLAAFGEDGLLLSANQSGRFQLGLAEAGPAAAAFEDLFGIPLAAALDLAARSAPAPCPLLLFNGIRVFVRIEPAPRRGAGTTPVVAKPAATLPAALAAVLRQALARRLPLLVEHGEETSTTALAAALRREAAGEAPWLEFDCSRPAALDAFLEGAPHGPAGPAAGGGVVFLANVQALDATRQSRLLAVLLAARPRKLPFALLCSCRGRLEALVAQGAFRHDLGRRLGARRFVLRLEKEGTTGEDLATITRQAIGAALAATGGNVSAAARRLGISRSTLYRRLQRD